MPLVIRHFILYTFNPWAIYCFAYLGVVNLKFLSEEPLENIFGIFIFQIKFPPPFFVYKLKNKKLTEEKGTITYVMRVECSASLLIFWLLGGPNQ